MKIILFFMGILNTNIYIMGSIAPEKKIISKEDFMKLIIKWEDYYIYAKNNANNHKQICELYIRYLLSIFIQLDSKKVLNYVNNKYPDALMNYLIEIHSETLRIDNINESSREILIIQDFINKIFKNKYTYQYTIAWEIYKLIPVDNHQFKSFFSFHDEIYKQILIKDNGNADIISFFIMDYSISTGILQEIINEFGSPFIFIEYPIYPNFNMDKKIMELKKDLNILKKFYNFDEKILYYYLINFFYEKFNDYGIKYPMNNFWPIFQILIEKISYFYNF